MRQLGTALTMYANQNQGHYPGPGWGTMDDDFIYMPPRDVNQSPLVPYIGVKNDALKALLICPEDIADNHGFGISGWPYSYTYNAGVYFENVVAGKVKHPSEKAIMYDENEH